MKGTRMTSDTRRDGADESGMPSREELEEPSVEKDPGEEPKSGTGDQPEPSHEAVGIGVVGQPQVDPEAEG